MNNDDKQSVYITTILIHNGHHQNNYMTLKITLNTEIESIKERTKRLE